MTSSLSEYTDIYKETIDNIPLHVIITDIEGKIVYANKAAHAITGYEIKEMIGQTPRLWGGLMDKDFYNNFWHTIKTERQTYSGIIKNQRKNGLEYYASIKAAPIVNSKNELIGFCGIEQDITEIQSISDAHDINERYRNILQSTIDDVKKTK